MSVIPLGKAAFPMTHSSLSGSLLSQRQKHRRLRAARHLGKNNNAGFAQHRRNFVFEGCTSTRNFLSEKPEGCPGLKLICANHDACMARTPVKKASRLPAVWGAFGESWALIHPLWLGTVKNHMLWDLDNQQKGSRDPRMLRISTTVRRVPFNHKC